MRRSHFSEAQTIGILKEHEAGAAVSELCRKHGVCDGNNSKWTARFGSMDISKAKPLRAQEDGNARLKRILADAMLDNAGIDSAGVKDLLGKKW